MNIAKKRKKESCRFSLTVCIFGIAGLLLLLSWFTVESTAFAQPNGDGHGGSGEQHEKPEGGSGPGSQPVPQLVPQIKGLECMTRVLGRIPTGRDEFTPEEQIKIAQECLGGNSGPTPGQGLIPGVPQLGDATRCAVELLGRIPTSRTDLSPEEQALIAQNCLGGQPQHFDGHDGGPPSGARVKDPRVLECIVSVIGRSPRSPEDLTNDERRVVGQQCFGGQDSAGNPRQGGEPRGEGPGDLSDEDLQCITDTIGRSPMGSDDLSDEEKRLLGRTCFAGHGTPGDGQGGNGGPSSENELDEDTLRCIEENLGRLPFGPEDMTDKEKRLIGQACFGGYRGSGEDPDDISDEELQCIVDTIGRLPTGPDDLTDQEKRLIGRACFTNQGGPDDLDDESFQCVIDTLGRMPEGPEDMSEEERRLVGRTCFAGERRPGGGEDDGPSAEEMQCIIDTIGRQPTGPDDISHEEKRLIGRACFSGEGDDKGPDDLSEETRQCIIAQLGYLPDSPGQLNDVQMDLVMAACFSYEGGERQGARAPQGLDAETQQCIIGIVGSLPENPEDLTQGQKGLIAQQCLGEDQGRGNARRPTNISTGMNPAVRNCIVSLVGRVPTASDDLTESEKRLIGSQCFSRKQAQDIQFGKTGPGQASGTQQPSTGTPQPGQSSTSSASKAYEASGQQSGGSDNQSSGDSIESTDNQPITSEQAASAPPAPAPVARPIAPSQQTLTAVEETIRDIIREHNDNDIVSAVWVIDRLSNLTGSKTAGLVLLNQLNHLVIKGKSLSVEDLAGVEGKIKR